MRRLLQCLIAQRLTNVLLGASLLTPAIVVQPSPDWRSSFPEEIKSFEDSAPGIVLVESGSTLTALDAATGKRLWERPGLVGFCSIFGCERRYYAIPGTHLVLVDIPHERLALDLESGTERWSFNKTMLSQGRQTFYLPSAHLFLASGFIFGGPHAIAALQEESGEMLWEQTALYGSPDSLEHDYVQYTAAVQDTDKTVVLFSEGGGLLRLNLDSGAILWRTPVKELGNPGRWCASLLNCDPARLLRADDGILLAWGKRLLAVGAENGKVLWARNDKLLSPVSQMRVTPHGVLIEGRLSSGWNVAETTGISLLDPFTNADDESVRTVATRFFDRNEAVSWHPYIMLIDPATGATTWTTEKTPFHARSLSLLEGNQLWVALNKGLVAYDVPSGQVVNEMALPGFSGAEDPCCLQRYSDGRLAMWSSQNIRMVDRSGKPIYSIYAPAPEQTLLKALTRKGDYWGRPFRETFNGHGYIYIFTETQATKFAVVCIDKETGKEVGRLPLGERDPRGSYAVNPATGVAIVVKDHEVSSYHVGPPE